MSVVFDVTYEGEAFEVEVFHDGHIEFPDRNFQHEQAMAEFTDSESAVLRFYNLWEESPTKVIFGNLELPENSILRLAADCAEHVLPVYEKKHKQDKRPRNAIIAARKYVNGKITLQELGEAASAASGAAKPATSWAASWAGEAASSAAAAAWKAAWATASSSAASAAAAAWATASSSAAAAARAAAWNASSDDGSAEWQQARAVETAWQVRRFVDVMESIGQDFDWPPIEATP
jgi:hypothetical protein